MRAVEPCVRPQLDVARPGGDGVGFRRRHQGLREARAALGGGDRLRSSVLLAGAWAIAAEIGAGPALAERAAELGAEFGKN